MKDSKDFVAQFTFKRLILLGAAIIGLMLTYLFQEQLVLHFFIDTSVHPYLAFVFKKSVRVILNDTCMLLFIYAWFNNQSITRTALWLQGIDTFILLPIYLTLKLSLEGDGEISSPLLSQLHRLIVNPTLMILFIPAVYFQRISRSA